MALAHENLMPDIRILHDYRRTLLQSDTDTESEQHLSYAASQHAIAHTTWLYVPLTQRASLGQAPFYIAQSANARKPLRFTVIGVITSSSAEMSPLSTCTQSSLLPSLKYRLKLSQPHGFPELESDFHRATTHIHTLLASLRSDYHFPGAVMDANGSGTLHFEHPVLVPVNSNPIFTHQYPFRISRRYRPLFGHVLGDDQRVSFDPREYDMDVHPNIQYRVDRAVHKEELTQVPVLYGDYHPLIPHQFPYAFEQALAEVEFYVSVDAHGECALTMRSVLILHSTPNVLLAA